MPKIMSFSKKLTASSTPSGRMKKTASAKPSGTAFATGRRLAPVTPLSACLNRIRRKIGAGPAHQPRPHR